jgi:hypothetical protein
VRWLVVLALLAGCKKDEPAHKGPAPMTEVEQERGVDLCRAYVKRLCDCATAKNTPELKDRCELHKGRPDTIATALAAQGEGVDPMDMTQAIDAARKVMAQCVKDMSKLDQDGCP